MSTAEISLPAGGVAWIVKLGVRAGGDRETLLAQAGLRPNDFQASDSRIPRQQSLALWRAICPLVKDPTLPVRYGQEVRPEALGVLGYLIQHAGTLGDLLELIHRYQKLTHSGAPIRLDRSQNRVSMGQRLLPEEVGLRYPAEFLISNFVALVRSAVGEMWSPCEVFFQHAEVPWVEASQRVFRCPVRFGEYDSGVLIDMRDLELRLPGSDPHLRGYLQATAERYLEQPPPRTYWISRTLRALADSDTGSEPDLEAISQKLGTSPRSLQRHLRDEGASYRKLFDQIRIGRAQSLLTRGELSVSEVADRLGYADPTAFTRAFRRRVGEPPSAFQQSCLMSSSNKHSS
ncbi:MAG: AraC family transcriptional regulator [Polyangiaceae bacterium]